MTLPETIKEHDEANPGPVKYRSVSQVKQYNDCGYQYYLQRRERAWQKPAAWLPQGTAVHAVAEDYERSGRTMTLDQAHAAFSEHYSDAVGELTEETPNLNFWYWSGPYSGTVDLKRRHDIGREQVTKYLEHCAKYPDSLPDRLNGTLAVELPFEVKFGDVEVRGFIDQVRNGKPIDVKTGNKPGDDFQLGTYSGALLALFDVQPTTGSFWMGRTGKLTPDYDLTDWTLERLADVFGEADEGIKAEVFEPKPEESKCRFCSVSRACEFSEAPR